jgi:hypothetical protein
VGVVPVLWALGLLWGLPVDPGALGGPGHLALAGEVLALAALAALALARGWRPGRGVIALATTAVLVLVLLRLADLVAGTVAGRPAEPLFDPLLLPALGDVVASGAGGPVGGSSLVLALAAGLAGLAWAIRAGLVLLLAGLAESAGRRALILLLVLAGLVQGAHLAGLTPYPAVQPGGRAALALGPDLAGRVARARVLTAGIQAALADDPVGSLPPGRALADLAGRDIIIVWVESYGRSALTDPRHARVGDRLSTLTALLAAAGFQSRSGWLDSPVLGGRSWLAHGTFRAGIAQAEVPVQTAVLAGGRRGLVHAARDGGWRTVAAMPGLAHPWPEGALWGFDRVVRPVDLPYAGPAHGWSPVPDQALLAGVEAMDLRGRDTPVYLEIVLTSSHAPWTPVPPWIDPPSAQGAGQAGMANGSAYPPPPPPDYTALADAYAASLDYSLRAVADWLVGHVDDDALVLVIGDHPAVTWIAEPPPGGSPRAVPVHGISRDGAVIDRLRDALPDTGMVPAADAPVLPMERMLPLMIDRFGRPGPALG